MKESERRDGLAAAIETELPYLRRYARALTGNQDSGDRYAVVALEAIVQDTDLLQGELSTRLALFKTFNSIWQTSGAHVEAMADAGTPEGRAQRHLSELTTNTREALLLHSIEQFSRDDIALIMDISVNEVGELLDIARSEMERSIQGRIMIIEDEAIIAMDISAIVEHMGHEVTGIARTRDGAVELARKQPPDMILADIQLADKSSGIDAVNHIFSEMGETPVVFITAYPERLLTGERPEPTFLIAKPYTESQVQSAVSQAMFFASTKT